MTEAPIDAPRPASARWTALTASSAVVWFLSFQTLLWWALWLFVVARNAGPLNRFPSGPVGWGVWLAASVTGLLLIVRVIARPAAPGGQPSVELNRRDALLLASGVVFAVLYWWRAVFTGSLPLNSLTLYYFQPQASLLSEYLQRGWPPLWNPWSNAGMPLMADPLSGAFYPPNLLLHAAGFVRGIVPWLLFHYALMFLFSYGALRERRSPTAAALGSALIVFGGYTLLRYGYMSHLASWAWTPFLLHAVDRERWRDVALGGALQLLAGHPQFFYMTALMSLAFLIGRRPALPFLARTAAAFATGGGLILFQILPSWELIRLSTRHGKLPFDMASTYSLSAYDLARMLFVPLWSWGRPWLTSDIFVVGFYIGLMGLALAVFALAVAPGARRSPATFWVAIGVLLALGRFTPLYRPLYHLLPGLGYFRFPGQWFGIAILGLAFLAADGLDRLRSRKLRAVLVASAFLELWLFPYRSPYLYARPAFLHALGGEALARRAAGGRFAESPRIEAWRYGDFPPADQWAPSAEGWLDIRRFALPSQGQPFHMSEMKSITNQVPLAIARLQASADPRTAEGRSILRRLSVRHVLDLDDPAAMRPDFRWMTIADPLPRFRTMDGRPWPLDSLQETPQAVDLVRSSPAPLDETMVMADTAFPGWRADAEGGRRAIHPIDGGLRGIEWRAGDRTLRLRYDAPLFFIGLILSTLWGAVLFWRTRRDRTLEPSRGWSGAFFVFGGLLLLQSLSSMMGSGSESNAFASAPWAFVSRRDFLIFESTVGLAGLVNVLFGAWFRRPNA